MNPCRKLRSRLLAVAAMLTLGAIMQAAAPVRSAAESAGVPLEPRTVYLTFDDGPSRQYRSHSQRPAGGGGSRYLFCNAGGTGGLFRCLCRPL